MAVRYVDFVHGNNANNGQGPDASHATNKPWKTLTKALGASGIASGDTLYLSPAGPFRETVAVAMTSAVAETKVVGDPQNQQGFKTSGGVAVAPGPVILTAYTTNDKTAPSATQLMDLQGRDFLTFQNIMFVSGNNSYTVDASTQTSQSITFTDCAFLDGYTGGVVHINVVVAFATALNWTVDRCMFVGMRSGNGWAIAISGDKGTGADYDTNFVVRNSSFQGSTSVRAIAVFVYGAAGPNFVGGMKVRNCSFFGGAITTGASTSTTVPACSITNSFIYAGSSSTPLNANAAGQIVEDYNLITAGTPRNNVTAGTHSIADGSYAPLFHFGQERLWGSPLFKPFLEPMQGSPLLGFTNDGNQTAYDLRNLQRPAGGASASPAAGALERHNNWITDPSPIGAGTSPIKITGPGDQAFLVPVPARAITISVVVKWDATYAGTKPQLQIDANGEIGVSAETKTATGSSGSNETLTLSAFTPSKAGRMVTVRVKSNDTNGAGVVQADSFAVSG